MFVSSVTPTAWGEIRYSPLRPRERPPRGGQGSPRCARLVGGGTGSRIPELLIPELPSSPLENSARPPLTPVCPSRARAWVDPHSSCSTRRQQQQEGQGNNREKLCCILLMCCAPRPGSGAPQPPSRVCLRGEDSARSVPGMTTISRPVHPAGPPRWLEFSELEGSN